MNDDVIRTNESVMWPIKAIDAGTHRLIEVKVRCEACRRFLPSSGCQMDPVGDQWSHAGPLQSYALVPVA